MVKSCHKNKETFELSLMNTCLYTDVLTVIDKFITDLKVIDKINSRLLLFSLFYFFLDELRSSYYVKHCSFSYVDQSFIPKKFQEIVDKFNKYVFDSIEEYDNIIMTRNYNFDEITKPYLNTIFNIDINTGLNNRMHFNYSFKKQHLKDFYKIHFHFICDNFGTCFDKLIHKNKFDSILYSYCDFFIALKGLVEEI
jgi:hypothetical protein